MYNVNHTKKVFLAAAVLLLSSCLPSIEVGTTTEENGKQTSTTPGTVSPGDVVVVPDPLVPPVNPPVVPPPVQTAEEGFTINGGDTLTSSADLLLTIIKYEALHMKISENANCSGGTWENYRSTKTHNLSSNSQNRVASISIQFSDYDSTLSQCFSAAILHDNRGPDILFQKYPVTSLEEGTATEVIYNVSDSGSGVASIECKLNDVVLPCSAGLATAKIASLAAGLYNFEIKATDNLGHSSQGSVSWAVTSSTRLITHDIHVDEYRKWDILFVIDNSGSMSYEQRNMAERSRNFLSVLRGLDWQAAVTTTDPRDITLGDGRLVQLADRKGEYILNSTMNEEAAQNTLGLTLQIGSAGSGSEQGIRSTYRAIERAMVAGSNESKLIRAGAHLAVVEISDEDESDNTLKNDPQALLSLVGEKFEGQKNFLFNSIITMPGDLDCRNTYGARYGERLSVMTALTSGVMGSVCASDYAGQVTGIAEKVKAMAQSFTLSCTPIAAHGIEILRNGVAVADPFTLDGVKLIFNQPVEPGDYKLKYHCLK